MKKVLLQKTAALALLLIVFSLKLNAQWNGDTMTNNIICNALGNQQNVQMIASANKSSIIAWEDNRGLYSQIFVQKIDSLSNSVWTANGVQVAGYAAHQTNHKLLADSIGGIYIVWEDSRNGTQDIYAQHLDSDGNLLWVNTGLLVCQAAYDQNQISLTKDGAGGIIIAWTDNRNKTTKGADVYAQRLSYSSIASWTGNGIAVATTASAEQNPSIVSDGNNGAYVFFEKVVGGIAQTDIYGARINSNGSVAFNNVVRSAISVQDKPRAISDNTGKTIVVWQEGTTGATYIDIVAASMSYSGAITWTSNICIASGYQQDPQIALSGNGAVISWTDNRNSQYPSIYAQRVDFSGAVQWAGNGVQVGANPICNQLYSRIATNGSGGAVIVYTDQLNSNTNIYAQNISSTGTKLWRATGIAIATHLTNQDLPVIVNDSSNNFIVAYQDDRVAANQNIYASKITVAGNLLPTSITDISIANKNNVNILSWTSKNEINVSHFNIEYSNNGKNFEIIGKVEAGKNGYNFIHNNYSALATHYYRLQIVDKDGKASLSKIVSINLTKHHKNLSIYPTITHQSVSAEIAVIQNSSYSISIVDITGRTVLKKSYYLLTGNNVVKIDCSMLQPSQYFISVQNGNEILPAKQFIKQ